MEKDYKKLYLEQKKLALVLEMQLLQMRALVLQTEIPVVEEELKTYVSEDKKTDPA
jgi:hypothetical protein